VDVRLKVQLVKCIIEAREWANRGFQVLHAGDGQESPAKSGIGIEQSGEFYCICLEYALRHDQR
ncbi:MAG: hypothetical protein N2595_00860, partial [bacterium]|nr:hypothetical protein [bacterium]